MMGNREIREEAWRLLWQAKWFWRLLGGSILLSVCTQVVYAVLDGVLYRLGVFNLTALSNALEAKARTGAALPEFTVNLAVQFASSLVLQAFFMFILCAIALYGNTTLLLRTVDDKEEDWLKAAFGGFKMPLGLSWLFFRLVVVYVAWYVLALLPGAAMFGVLAVKMPLTSTVESSAVYAFVTVVAASLVMAIICIPLYRYRYLFRLKADNPDWSAGRCFRECVALVDGAKWRIFVHDCSYWRTLLVPLLWFALLCIAAVVAFAGQAMGWWSLSGARVYVVAIGVIVLVVSYLALIILMMVIALYIGVGQTVLYREISAEKGLLRQQ